jgi:mRNA interferase MazF
LKAAQRGDIWLLGLDPVKGHEQGGRRPCLVVSANPFNKSAAELIVVLPLTSQEKGVPSHVLVDPPEAGLKKKSYIKCEDIRSVSSSRLVKKYGSVSRDTMRKVEYCVCMILDLL